jgi:LL-diaminopimelate aminotransferase
MIRVNENYSKLAASYLFALISKKVSEYQDANPGAKIIRLGIGDVTMPLPSACIMAMHDAVNEMSVEKSFRGYGPYEGYDFLREAIAADDYRARGINIDAGEIFVSDGAKSDTANIQELFAPDIRIALPDPVYPVYVDTNVMAGRTGLFNDARYSGIVYLESSKENSFVPSPPKEAVDLIYLCFPNNPTGAVAKRDDLARWVEYARRNKALIVYDAAYEAFVRDDEVPRSIFEIEGADEVAVECRSYSKTAGFTGLRCSFTVIPHKCAIFDEQGASKPLQQLWMRRLSTKFNGVSYPVQRAAWAVHSLDGKKQVKELIDHYLGNADIIRNAVKSMGYYCAGGDNSPYIWVDMGMDSWEAFDMLLKKTGVVVTPGSGFGKCGEGFIRISAFNSRENVLMAVESLKKAL